MSRAAQGAGVGAASSSPGSKARSDTSPAPKSGGGASSRNGVSNGASTHARASSTSVVSGDDEEEDDDDAAAAAEEDDEYDEEDLGADMIARAAQDFASMRMSVDITSGQPRAAAAAGGGAAEPAAASREELRVHACIAAGETARDSKGEYILYILSVTAGGSATGLSWKVGRRFREFEALHTKLCAKFGKDHLPSLPKKTLRRSLDPEYVRHKKTELAKYMSDLMLDPSVACCEPLAHFLIVNIQDILKSSIENLRIFAQRGSQVKQVEQLLFKSQTERKKAERATLATTREVQELKDRVSSLETMQIEAAAASKAAAEAAEVLAQQNLAALQAEWEVKYAELAAHTKALHKEKKSALKFVQDLDVLTRKLKAEKKILVKEVKDQRARMAALGALGTVGDVSEEANGVGGGDGSGGGSECGTGSTTPALSRGGMASPKYVSSSSPPSSSQMPFDPAMLTLATDSPRGADDRSASPSFSPNMTGSGIDSAALSAATTAPDDAALQ